MISIETKKSTKHYILVFLSLVMLFAGPAMAQRANLLDTDQGQGPFSYANINDIEINHIALDLTADFDAKTLNGVALLRLKWKNPAASNIILDTDGLDISKLEGFGPDGWVALSYSLSNGEDVLGQKLTIFADRNFRAIRVYYTTSPTAKGLDWYSTSKDRKRNQPFLTSIWGPTNARSWIPLQDTPAVRLTFEARLHTAPTLNALMSAEQDPDKRRDGDYYFYMREDIPPHHISLVIGQFSYKKINDYMGVYAPTRQLEETSATLNQLTKISTSAITLFGFKPFKRLDFILAPDNFPQNHQTGPRLSLISPNLIHGDGQLDTLFYDILGEAFYGNVISNSTWADAWLNKGISPYIGNFLMKLNGETELANHIRARKFFDLELIFSDDTKPLPNLYEHAIYPNPKAAFDESSSLKTYFFFTMLENIIGDETQSMFLKTWLKDKQGTSQSTKEFQHFMGRNLLYLFPNKLTNNLIDTWFYQPGLPASIIPPDSEGLISIESDALEWLSDNMQVNQLPADNWGYTEWVHFIETIAEDVKDSQLDTLNKFWKLSQSENTHLQAQWFHLVIETRYDPGYDQLETYLENQTQRDLIIPLYDKMAASRTMMNRARKIFENAEKGYHPDDQETIRHILKLDQ